MRKSLDDAIRKAILVECRLPHKESNTERSSLSNLNDVCLQNTNPQEISKVIYNGIVEFAISEFEIDYEKLESEQRKAIVSRIRYDSSADNSTKLKYGFYGEVLLDLILRTFLSTSVLAARGYFYSPIERSEAKGFDAFHIMERNGKIDLWFGEAKFYQNYKQAITPVIEKIETSLSDGYIDNNFLAIINQKSHLSTCSTQILELIDDWENNPDINLADEIRRRNMRLIYPIFIAYQKNLKDNYIDNIRKCITHIAAEHKKFNVTIPTSIDYRLFFIFLPLDEVKRIKEQVIEWIERKEPLI